MNETIRVATFNAFLNRPTQGELIEDLSTPNDAQAQAVAEIIQRVNPDVILLNEFDFDENGTGIQLFQDNYLSVSQNGAAPVEYPYVFLAPSNTGRLSGFDLNNDGIVATEADIGTFTYANDSFGFGFFPGNFAMVLLSRFPILEDQARTFQNFVWQEQPGALLPDLPNTPEPQDFYSPEELAVYPLADKSLWDVPINFNGEIIHILANHPTPPVFDDPVIDFNGRQNSDEIRFWADYITPGAGEYIQDDEGNFGGLAAGESFVIVGDQNADPFDGDSTPPAISQLLDSPFINTSVTPSSAGGPEAAERQGGFNFTHEGNPAFDTADFGNPFPFTPGFSDNTPGNLRVDYALPSADLEITDAGVFYPTSDDPLFRLIENENQDGAVVSSDHRLVFVDVATAAPTPEVRRTVRDVEFLGQTSFPTGTVFEGTEVGGLSGLTYDAFNDVYYSISDDQGNRTANLPTGVAPNEPARFYTLTIDIADGNLEDGDIEFIDVTTLLDGSGSPFAPGTIDAEGIAFTNQSTLFISSEGNANNLIAPFV
ncbi:MAG: hypothetical protein HC890_16125, partial [Chloroflexaceae bacterium]|nr:hypothetical protein [Chloroflexaceae bacterium]